MNIVHIKSREEWLHPSAYHPDAVQQLRDRVIRQPYWRVWLNEHATAAWFRFAAGVSAVAAPALLAWLIVR